MITRIQTTLTLIPLMLTYYTTQEAYRVSKYEVLDVRLVHQRKDVEISSKDKKTGLCLKILPWVPVTMWIMVLCPIV